MPVAPDGAGWLDGRRRGVTAALVCLLALAACDDPAEDVAAPEPAKPAQIALVMKTLTNPFFTEMERGARAKAQELGVELIVRTAAQETSIEQQIGIIDSLVQQRVDGIVIAPGDSARIVPVLKKAQDAGIELVNVDNEIEADVATSFGLSPIPFISVDNAEGAYQAVRGVLDASDGEAASHKAVLFDGILGAANAQARRQGAMRAFAEAGVEVVATTSADWQIQRARAMADGVFADHPEITIVFAANDMMALGVLDYLEANRRNDVRVIGFDALPEALAALRDGRLAATVDQNAAAQGSLGVDYAVRAIAGETLPPVTMLQTRVVRAEAVEP